MMEMMFMVSMVDMVFRGDMVDIVSLFNWSNIVVSCPTRLSSIFQHPENRGIVAKC